MDITMSSYFLLTHSAPIFTIRDMQIAVPVTIAAVVEKNVPQTLKAIGSVEASQTVSLDVHTLFVSF